MFRSIKPPKGDIRKIVDVAMNLYTYPSIIIAHRLGVFEFIAVRPRSIEDICEGLQLEKRSVEAVMSTLHASQLVYFDAGLFSLAEESREFLLKDSPQYFGHYWDILYDNSQNFSLKNLELAIKKNQAQIHEEQVLFNTQIHDAETMREFTRGMHSMSLSSASFWPSQLSLAKYQHALDIGGGSGVHAIGMATNWPHLSCTVFELPAVCSLSADYIRQYELSERVKTLCGDMWKDDFPDADLHFYSNIFHDWPTEKNLFLAKKSYASLPKGGRIIVHEILYNDTGPGPYSAAAASLMMLGWTEGQQYSGKDIRSLLSQAGFQNIEVISSLGYYSIVTAIKN